MHTFYYNGIEKHRRLQQCGPARTCRSTSGTVILCVSAHSTDITVLFAIDPVMWCCSGPDHRSFPHLLQQCTSTNRILQHDGGQQSLFELHDITRYTVRAVCNLIRLDLYQELKFNIFYACVLFCKSLGVQLASWVLFFSNPYSDNCTAEPQPEQGNTSRTRRSGISSQLLPPFP